MLRIHLMCDEMPKRGWTTKGPAKATEPLRNGCGPQHTTDPYLPAAGGCKHKEEDTKLLRLHQHSQFWTLTTVGYFGYCTMKIEQTVVSKKQMQQLSVSRKLYLVLHGKYRQLRYTNTRMYLAVQSTGLPKSSLEESKLRPHIQGRDWQTIR